MPAKRLDRLADAGISVHRKDNRGVISVGDARHRAANAGDPPVEAFAAVTRHKNHSPAREMRGQNGRAPRTQVWPGIQENGHPQQMSDAGTPRRQGTVWTGRVPPQKRAGPVAWGEL